ncbi:RagB/SusD family nutrient uptake outer membrane protein [Pontibacter sp. KCTC 32443]|uniref:RagB/SusD family nutrient uptake outer membrane protein n=1 Tax=Pontibacter TaxID=323449 RepID=UPI00164EAE05|nr:MULTISPECIES: RagB/SusD family nutrient uptake outer membrane protein [Pontibacter]MBC5772749.1 RagB/SusD family nutrient uptake outer membrane protein [Pontibacter sp. KCTC 32443]
MTSRYLRTILCAGLVTVATTSCINDLDREPFYEATSASVYKDFANYKMVLAKLYGGLAVTGQQGPDGKPDVRGIDEGASNYVRAYWILQEVPTDEAVIGWNDPGLPVINTMSWSSNNDVTTAMYYRIFYQITLANEFIRETSDSKLAERGITGANLEQAKLFRAEARFLRAMSYWHALDMYGSVPFVTEEDAIGAFFPEQISKEDLFAYIEGELIGTEGNPGIVDLLAEPRQNEYGRADKAAAWTLLTKLYLNAKTYINQEKYTEAIEYAEKVINAGYTLEEDYDHLFMADNHTSNEIIFPVAFDGQRTRSYGGTTFLTHAAVGGTMTASNFGIDSGWGGIRSTPSMYNLFSGDALQNDDRANFHTDGQELEISTISTFTEGYPITKWSNKTSTNVNGSNATFVDTDFPMFRLADVYLMYAEAVVRSGAPKDQAVEYINELRTRAYTNGGGTITSSELTLDFILDERARELNWEGHRRTDLIRFGKFTSDSYVWAWKGGVAGGTGVADYKNLYPIPANDLIANPNLEPTPGY